MSQTQQLYQQVILEHNKKPRNFRVIENATHYALGKNPLCGDQFAVYAVVEDGVVKDIAFQGSGCAIAKASASLMTTNVTGKGSEEAVKLRDQFQGLVTGTLDPNADNDLGRLTIFEGVREFPVRVKCATLAWHTLAAALEGQQQEVTTE